MVEHARQPLHDRQAEPKSARNPRALFEPASRVKGLSLLPFESGIELRVGRDKGGAARAIVDQVGAHTPVAFLGDDLTDESAFRSINRTENPHVTVLVRRALRDTSAEIWLKPPEELRWFLKRWLNATTGEWGTSFGLRHIENASDGISSHAAQG